MKDSLVNHPKHYQGCSELGKYLLIDANFPYLDMLDLECIEVIENLGLTFCLGNCLKYLWRLGRKTPLSFINIWKQAAIYQDLSKAEWYINRHISNYYAYDGLNNDQWVFNLHTQIMQELTQMRSKYGFK